MALGLAFAAHADVAVSSADNAVIVDFGTSAVWSGQAATRIGGPSASYDLIGFASFDLSAFTAAELNASTFDLDFSTVKLSTKTYPASQNAVIEYLGTYTDDNVRGDDAGSANLTAWMAASSQGSVTVDLGAAAGSYSDVGITLADDTFANDYAIFRFSIETQTAADEQTDFTGVTLNVIPEPATLGMVAVFGGGILFIRRRFMI